MLLSLTLYAMKDKTKYIFSCVRMALNGGETTLLCMSVLFCVNVGLWPVSLPNVGITGEGEGV